MNRRPNVIVCMCDQMRPFELGCYGHAVVRTPNLDRLAAGGVHFTQAFSNSTLCTPARSCLLSGQYTRTCTGTTTCCGEPIGVRRQLPQATLPEVLRQAGYDTQLLGKWHVEPHPKLVGFDHVLFPKAHHLNADQEYEDDSGRRFIVPGWNGQYESDRLRELLLSRRGAERPLFLYYNISLPHMPYFDVPRRYRTMYSRDEVVLRENVYREGALAHDEHWFRIYLYDYLYYKLHRPGMDALPDGFDLRDLTALYWGMVSAVDDLVGAMMEHLAEAALSEDTIVVFLSDHGDNLGSHHMWNKLDLIEESIRIPCMIHWPGGLAPRRIERQVISQVDVMPTLLGLLGLPTPPHVQGTDLSAVVTGRSATAGENAAFIETHHNQVGVRTPTHVYGILIDREHPRRPQPVTDERHMFFDLHSDPFQLHDLARTDAHAKLASELRRRVLRWHEETPWLEPAAG